MPPDPDKSVSNSESTYSDSNDIVTNHSNSTAQQMDTNEDRSVVSSNTVETGGKDENSEEVNLNKSEQLEMSTVDKANQYDELKGQFSALQNKFESLAKILGNHGINVGDAIKPSQTNDTLMENKSSDQNSTTESNSSGKSNNEEGESTRYMYHGFKQEYNPYGLKLEPSSYGYGWQNSENAPFRPDNLSQEWTSMSSFTPPQPVYRSSIIPAISSNYNLPYPPPEDYTHHLITPGYHTPHSSGVLPYPSMDDPFPKSSYSQSSFSFANQTDPPISKGKMSRKSLKKKLSQTAPYNRNEEQSISKYGKQVESVDQSAQGFQGVISAPKKSFKGPSKTKASSVQNANYQVDHTARNRKIDANLQLPGKLSRPIVQTLYPPPNLFSNDSSSAERNVKRSSAPKLGARPKPSPKQISAPSERRLQASNPFRNDNKPRKSFPNNSRNQVQSLRPSVKGIRRGSQSNVHTLFPPVRDYQTSGRPEVEVVGGVSRSNFANQKIVKP